MSVALLIGAPKSSAGGGKVRLMAGEWLIRVRGLVDSKLNLNVNQSLVPLLPDHKLSLSTPTEAIVTFAERGSEDYVSVTAELKR